jgi:carbon monoxide dehydrogenase subunit G
MKLEQSFEIVAPVETVWAALIDVEFVAPCLPGAEVTGREDDGSYKGTFTVKLGPTTASYNGVLRIEDADETTHTATLHARGTDKRGQGAATATIVNRMTQTDGGTRVDAATDFTITGRLARFGRAGMIEDISNRLLRDFASCLQAKLAQPPDQPGAPDAVTAPEPQAAPVPALSLFFSVLLDRLRRLFRRR